MDECALCLEEIGSDVCNIPGCGHRVHTSCLLTAAQYDVRCPLCRRVPEGVKVKGDEEPFQSNIVDLERLHQNLMHERRRWQNKNRS